MKRETLAHLHDIRDVHGPGRHWAELALPQGTPRLIAQPLRYSPFGSPAARCLGGSAPPRRISTWPT